jgi:hypothetical protein
MTQKLGQVACDRTVPHLYEDGGRLGYSPSAKGTPKSHGFENCASQRHYLQILYINYHEMKKKHKYLLLRSGDY